MLKQNGKHIVQKSPKLCSSPGFKLLEEQINIGSSSFSFLFFYRLGHQNRQTEKGTEVFLVVKHYKIVVFSSLGL